MKKIICLSAFVFFLLSVSCFSQTHINASQKKINSGFVFISPDFSSDAIDTIAGTKLYFTLAAKDSLGNIIQDWDVSGSTITIELKNSSANIDSNARSWNSDADGFSFADISISNSSLPQPKKITDSSWEIAPTSFVQGQVQLSLIDTKVENGIYLQIFPQKDLVKQSSAMMNLRSDSFSNYLVEITSQTNKPDQVYVLHKYEVVVTPRDKYLNYSNEEVPTNFSARFPGEFVKSPFDKEHIQKGMTAFYFTSIMARPAPQALQLQYIVVFKTGDYQRRNRSNYYEILSHEPGTFTVQEPPNNAIIKVEPNAKAIFSWSDPNPPEPFKNIRISRFDSTLISDTVHYTLYFFYTKNGNYQTFLSNNDGTEPTFTLDENQLLNMMKTLSGSSSIKSMDLLWYIEANDGYYKVLSDPKPGLTIRLNKTFPYDVKNQTPPVHITLHQNYPNPFGTRIGSSASSTMISFTLDRSSQIILTVYDALGKELSTLANDFYVTGEHTFKFDAINLPAGNYFYRLFANGKVLTKQMTVIK